jgi:thymidylate kinase
VDFHQRVQTGYRRIAALEPQRFRLIDADDRPEEIAKRIWAIVSPFLDRAEYQLSRSANSANQLPDEP